MPVKAKKSKSSSAGRTLSRLLAKFFAGAAVFFCAFSAFFAIQAHACERGEAKVEIDHEGRYSSAARGKYVLLFCDGVFFDAPEGRQLAAFLESRKGDANFRRQASQAIGMKYNDIIKAASQAGGDRLAPFADTSSGLQYLAGQYPLFIAEQEKARRAETEKKYKTFPVRLRELSKLAAHNKRQIQAVKAKDTYSCPRLSAPIHVLEVAFQDGESFRMLPVDMKPAGTKNRHELSYFRPYLNLVFYNNTELFKRVLEIPPSGSALWFGPDGKKHPISRSGGFKRYADFAAFTRGGIARECDLRDITSKLVY